MKLTQKTFAFIFIFLSIFYFSQTSKILKIKYMFTYLKDSTDTNSSRHDIMSLDIDLDKTIFYSDLKFKGDSLLNIDKEKNDLATLMLNRDQYNGKKLNLKIFINRITNNIIFNNTILTNTYTYTEPLMPQNWTITNATENFMGYKIIKATTKYRGRNYIAWFSPDLVFPFGPYKFNGLPGLILKLTDDKKNFVYECIYIKNDLPNNYLLEKLNSEQNKIATTRLNYSKIEENATKDFLNFTKHTFSEIQINAVKPEKTKEKPYNPIELN